MNKLIVLEGADSSGKTTLAKKIGGVYMHAGPMVNYVEHGHDAMLQAAMRCLVHGNVVIDRHWVSELIYGPVFRGFQAYSDDKAREFDLVIRRLGTYVLCVPSDAAAHEARFQKERPAKGDIFDTMQKVAEDYRRLAHGYMHEERFGFLWDYVRHGDFTEGCFVYDLDRHGGRVDDIARQLRETGQVRS